MIKLLFILSVLMVNTASFATANFTSNTGTFVIPDVSVNGSKNYESVTLQLNVTNGTFAILDATPKDTSFSEASLETVLDDELKVDFHGCARSGLNQIDCMIQVTSPDRDARIFIYLGLYSTLVDNLRHEYPASSASVLDQTVKDNGKTDGTSGLLFDLTQGTPVKIRFTYNDINLRASSILNFMPRLSNANAGFNWVLGDFKNIDF